MTTRPLILPEGEEPILTEPFATVTADDLKRILRLKRVQEYLKKTPIIRNAIFAKPEGEYSLPPATDVPTSLTIYSGVSGYVKARWIALRVDRNRGYTFDRNLGRYRDRQTGRLVREATVLRAIEDSGQEFLSKAIKDITEDFIAGDLSVDNWQKRIAGELKILLVLTGTAGRGGRGEMRNVDFLEVARELKFQYSRLDNFARQIAQGNYSKEYIKNRSNMYSRSVRKVYFRAKTTASRHAGYTHEQRFLRPGESCADCVGYANQGRVPIGRLPEPGEASVCRQNCNCIKRYFKDDGE